MNQVLRGILEDRARCQKLERCLFGLYRESQEAESFSGLTEIFGRRYPLIAYLFFLKDRDKYLPIAPTKLTTHLNL